METTVNKHEQHRWDLEGQGQIYLRLSQRDRLTSFELAPGSETHWDLLWQQRDQEYNVEQWLKDDSEIRDNWHSRSRWRTDGDLSVDTTVTDSMWNRLTWWNRHLTGTHWTVTTDRPPCPYNLFMIIKLIPPLPNRPSPYIWLTPSRSKFRLMGFKYWIWTGYSRLFV